MSKMTGNEKKEEQTRLDEEQTSNKEARTRLFNEIIKRLKAYDFEESECLLNSAIGKYPHAPEPHNLLGILYERKNDHALAMKHFRAAWALDPTYLPARHNLELYGTFFSSGHCAYEASDCKLEESEPIYKVEYDENGIGRIVRRHNNEGC